MQQEASRKINFTIRKTMQVAQSLYEGVKLPEEGLVGLITYMRTDSTRISDQAVNMTLDFIEENYGKDYVGRARKAKKKSENVQDAHECIRPTDVRKTPYLIKDSLNKDQFKLYELIWKRFVASLMKQASFATNNIEIISNNESFKLTGSILKFDGFLKVYAYDNKKDEVIPQMKVGDKLKLKELIKDQHFTQAPPRYNEASLIKTLEDLGIGRPSTYSPTISTLQTRYYVVNEDKKLIPTELGLTVNKILCENFESLVNKEFTAKMEADLDKVANGNLKWKELVRVFYDKLKIALDKAYENIEKVQISDPVTDVICEKCGRHMVVKMGRFGKFLACPGFPECRNAKPYVEKIGVKCPKCKDGDIAIKMSKKGRKFFGCTNYPKCDFVSWNKPVDEFCPKCGNILVEVANRKGKTIRCSNATCSYVKKKSKDE